jgi:integrase/recombinase XerD
VDGKEETHAEGAYYISWYAGKKCIRLSVGKDAADAANQRELKQAQLKAVNKGEVPELSDLSQLPRDDGRKSLLLAVAEYLEETKLSKKPKTYAAYATALQYFMESCTTKIYVSDIDRKDLLRFSAFLRDEKEQGQRSVYNKFENLMTFLKAQGIRGTALKVTKHDWPKFVEEDPEIYEKADLEKLFAACTEEERLWFEFFQMTGMREQEVMYVYWRDVNLAEHTVRVTHKPDRNWTPKGYKEREIPIPAKLAESLRQRKAKSDKTCNLVFPTSGCNPKFDFLDCLKAIAKRTTLNPDGSPNPDGLNPEIVWLHKFRATFATWHLWAGVDLRTVQSWLGHSDLESTLRYLRPNRSQEVKDKVNATFA